MTPIKNMKSLIIDLSIVYEDLRCKKIEPDEAVQVSKMASNIIRACGVQLKYNDYMGVKGKEIPFMEYAND
jgi:hypothetical protein